MAERDRTVRMLAVEELSRSFEKLGRDMGKREWRREELYER